MDDAADMGEDAPPRSGVGQAGQIGLIITDDIGWEVVMQRAVSHGHLDGPDFIHPEAGLGDAIKTEEPRNGENQNQYGELTTGRRRRWIGHRRWRKTRSTMIVQAGGGTNCAITRTDDAA